MNWFVRLLSVVALNSTQSACPPHPVMLLMVGDSISYGAGSSSAQQSLGQQIVDHLPCDVRLRVAAQPGRPMREVLARFETDLPRPLTPALHVVFVHAGDNDVAKGLTGKEIYADLTAFVSRAHRDGWKVVVSTELQRFDFKPQWQHELDTYNDMMRKDRAGADALVDYAAEPTMGPQTNRGNRDLYNLDGVHPADKGYGILAKLTADAISRVVEQTRQPKT